MRMLTMMIYWTNIYTAWRNGARKDAGGHESSSSHAVDTQKYTDLKHSAIGFFILIHHTKTIRDLV